MQIHCDACTKELSGDHALKREVDGEVYYYCSEDCRSKGEVARPVLEPDDREEGPEGPSA